MNIKYLFFSLFALIVLSACKPNSIEIEVYTSDIKSVANGEVLEVPLKASFNLMGEDKENQLPKAKIIALKYLPSDSEVQIAEGTYGKVMSVVTTIPIGNKTGIQDYLKKNSRLAAVLVEGGTVKILPTPAALKNLNKELSTINFMLSVKLPASSSTFRIVADTKEKMNISAIAVFSEKKPYLLYSKDVKRRKSIELKFMGGDGSVYKEIPPQFSVK